LPRLEDDYGEEYVPPHAAELAEVVGHRPDIQVRPIHCISPSGVHVSVHFDRCTHASGMQRAFVACPHHSAERCRRYVFLHNYASSAHAAAWLLAWAAQEPIPVDKAAHLLAEPEEECCELIRAELN